MEETSYCVRVGQRIAYDGPSFDESQTALTWARRTESPSVEIDFVTRTRVTITGGFRDAVVKKLFAALESREYRSCTVTLRPEGDRWKGVLVLMK